MAELQRIHRAPLKKGLSELLGGLIMITILLALVVPFMLYVISSRQAQEQTYLMARAAEGRKKLERIVFKLASATDTEKVYQIWNNGSVPSQIRYLIVREVQQNGSTITKVLDALKLVGQDVDGYSIELKDRSQIIANSYIEIQPQGYIELRTPSNAYLVTLSTNLGETAEEIGGSGGGTGETGGGAVEYAKKAGSVVVNPVSVAEEVSSTIQNIASGNEEEATQSKVQVDPDEVKKPTSEDPGVGMIRSDGQMLVVIADITNVTELYFLTTSTDCAPSFFIRLGAAYIGFDPKWTTTREGPPRYSMLLTGTNLFPTLDGNCHISSMKIYIRNATLSKVIDLHEQTDTFLGWRIKIVGFQPENDEGLILQYKYYDSTSGESRSLVLQGSEALGLWWLYGASSLRVRYIGELGIPIYNTSVLNVAILLKLRGNASRVIIYGTDKVVGTEREFSYEPFFLFADVDGNGVPEFVFATIDANFGNVNEDNDCAAKVVLDERTVSLASCDINLLKYKYGVTTNYEWIKLQKYVRFDDMSVKPFWINMTGYRIDASKYSMVLVSIRVYFHDNLGGDTNEVDHTDRVMFGVYLIDAETGAIASSREYIYQELDDLEDTWPPNRNFVVFTIPLIVPKPPPGETKYYFLAIAFQDPYGNKAIDEDVEWGYDDGDFVIAIEWLGISLFARPS